MTTTYHRALTGASIDLEAWLRELRYRHPGRRLSVHPSTCGRFVVVVVE